MTTSPTNPRPAQRWRPAAAKRKTLAVVFGYFLVAGVATVMLGPTLPLLAERWRLPDAQLGTLFFAYFFGQLCGAWFATRRLGISLLVGAGASALGFCALAITGAAGAHLVLFIIGVGLGAGLTAGNVIVGTIDNPDADALTFDDPASHRASESAEGHRARLPDASAELSSRSRLLALLNLSWGIGAITCPLWLRASVGLSLALKSIAADPAARSSGVFFLGLAAGFASVAALIAWLLPRRLYGVAGGGNARAKIAPRILWVFVATFALYVGVENALAGWLPTYAERLADGGVLSGRAAEIALCFWISELVGRALTAAVVKRIDEWVFYRVCLGMVIATIAVLVVSPHLGKAWIFALTAVLALGLSPLFPLAVSFLLAQVGSDPKVGKIFASSSLGGSLLPWLTGVGSARFESLRLGFLVPAIGATLILLLSWSLPQERASFKVADR